MSSKETRHAFGDYEKEGPNMTADRGKGLAQGP